jgi:hypothetical protein
MANRIACQQCNCVVSCGLLAERDNEIKTSRQ